jgi:hypothetical protein
MISEFLIFGSIGFYIFAFLFVVFIVCALEIETENPREDYGGGGKATFIFFAALAVYFFFGSNQHLINIGLFLKENLGTAFFFFFLYFGIGVVWSFFKWFFFLRKIRDGYNDRGYKIDQDDIPVAKKNKNRLASWITYWPLSGFWTLVNDPVRKFVNILVESFGGFYDKMSASAFEGHVKENKE